MEKIILCLVGVADVMATMTPVGHLVATAGEKQLYESFKLNSSNETIILKSSNSITKTYYVDTNMKTRNSLPVMSIVTDQANFFDNQ